MEAVQTRLHAARVRNQDRHAELRSKDSSASLTKQALPEQERLEYEKRIAGLQHDNKALHDSLERMILKCMYGESVEQELEPKHLDAKAQREALLEAEAALRDLQARHQQYQGDAAQRIDEVRVHYEQELEKKMRVTSKASPSPTALPDPPPLPHHRNCRTLLHMQYQDVYVQSAY